MTVSCSDAGAGVTLQGGSGPHEGNVFVNGQPVCDDEWDTTDGRVVCHQLGYDDIIDVTIQSTYGTVSSVFIMDNVECTGSETDILQCPHLSTDNCGSGDGAGVICAGIISDCTSVIDKVTDVHWFIFPIPNMGQ